MIRFSFSSFNMSFIFANVMIIFLYFLFRKQKRMIKFGLPVLGVTTCLIILRMLLPFEIMFLSHNIYFPEIVSKVISNFLKPRFLDGQLSYWSLIKIVWVGGIFVSAARCAINEIRLSKIIAASRNAFPENSPANRVFRRLQEEIPKARNIRLYGFPTLINPMIYGLFKPCILIPEEHDCNELQLSYILRHEIEHYLHFDIFLKLFIKSVCIIYWWNPFCKLLLEQAETIIEVRVDRAVAKRPNEKMEYLSSLLAIAKLIVETDDINKKNISDYFCNKSTSVLAIRFNMPINDNPDSPYNRFKCIIITILISLFVLSYTYIFESRYISPQYEFDSYKPDENNSYFIKVENGTYRFYFDGEYRETVDSLEYFDNSIPVYEKEVKTNEN